MSAETAIKQILSNLRDLKGVSISAVISKNGIPLAWEIPSSGHQIETFATLSATILGASEVVYSGLGFKVPNLVIIEGNDGTFVARGVTSKAILVLVAKKDQSELIDLLDKTADEIREVLSYGK